MYGAMYGAMSHCIAQFVRLAHPQQDPTVGWSISGRAQRSGNGNGFDDGLSDDGVGGRGGDGADLEREIENEDADR